MNTTFVAFLPFVLLMLLLVHAAGCSAGPSSGERDIRIVSDGEVDGRSSRRFQLRNRDGMEVEFSDYGATVTRVIVPDRNGVPVDVVLGFDTVEEYPAKSQYFGCTVGRVGNRIADGRFELDGRSYELATNNGAHHLHGGERGFDRHIWEASEVRSSRGPGVRFRRRSPDGEEGYPGTLDAEVLYVLTERNELLVEMSARSDAATPCNLVNHTYWNLGGHDSGDVLESILRIDADAFTPVDPTFIPTGEILSVEGTPLDFRRPKAIGLDITQLPSSDEGPGGFDHNLCLNGPPGAMRPVARLISPSTGIAMSVETDQPGLQFYSGNFIERIQGKGGAVYEKHAGVCLETQLYPDAINRLGERGWPDPVLRPGEAYRHRMVHRFEIVGGETVLEGVSK